MKKILLMALMAIVATTAASAKKSESKANPEGDRIVLKAADGFDAVTLNAPVTVEFINDAEHPGFIVYHSTVKGELKVYNKGSELVIAVKDEFKNKKLNVTSRVVVCYNGGIDRLTINGSGALLAKSLDSRTDVKYIINGSGDIKVGDVSTNGTFTANVNGSGDIDLHTLKATSIAANVNGSGDIEIEEVNVTDAALNVNGSGDLNIKEINATTVSAAVNGSGDLEVKGSTVNANLGIHGSGDLDAGSLQADNTNVTGTGSGDVSCRASKSLSVNASKGCNVQVCGPRPKQVNIKSNNVHFSSKK